MGQLHGGRCRIGSIGRTVTSAALLLGGMLCVSGCGDDAGDGMVAAPKDATKSNDAMDSMKDYMKQMQKHGMKPGMKSEAPAK